MSHNGLRVDGCLIAYIAALVIQSPLVHYVVQYILKHA
jgi:hypothetical protein